jgi:hypothetical protein
MSIADPNKTILTGENPFVRLSPKNGEPNSTEASYWRIIFSPAGPGHVLYLKSGLTEQHWRIYSDNIAMADAENNHPCCLTESAAVGDLPIT